MEDGLVDFFSRCRPCTFIELAMQPDIILEEIQPLHIQPLMGDTGNEVVRFRILNQAGHLRL